MPLLDTLVQRAHTLGASDLHLEPGLAAMLRVDGALRSVGEPLAGAALAAEARRILTDDRFAALVQRRSADLSRSLGGVRCRINILHSSRGVGFAIRLLAAFQASLASLNLHPELARFAHRSHGLVVVTGPTGSGKSATVAALVQEINRSQARHVITLEQPIEHLLRPRRAFIRQREVGRDTPSFAQGLLDALREDPDVLVVGEMRHPETMQLTLNAAETGHLVLTTMHSSSVGDALARLISAFPPDSQASVQAQLADCLVAVISQRLVLDRDLGIRLPELEVLVSTDAVRAAIRSNQLHRMVSAMQTGAADGMWTFDRYRRWMGQERHRFVVPSTASAEPLPAEEEPAAPLPAATRVRPRASPRSETQQAPAGGEPGVLVLDGFDEDLQSILSELD